METFLGLLIKNGKLAILVAPDISRAELYAERKGKDVNHEWAGVFREGREIQSKKDWEHFHQHETNNLVWAYPEISLNYEGRRQIARNFAKYVNEKNRRIILVTYDDIVIREFNILIDAAKNEYSRKEAIKQGYAESEILSEKDVQFFEVKEGFFVRCNGSVSEMDAQIQEQNDKASEIYYAGKCGAEADDEKK